MALDVAAVEAAGARLVVKVITQVSRAVPAVLMVAAAAEAVMMVTELKAQSVSSGQEQPEQSHRPVQAIFN